MPMRSPYDRKEIPSAHPRRSSFSIQPEVRLRRGNILSAPSTYQTIERAYGSASCFYDRADTTDHGSKTGRSNPDHQPANTISETMILSIRLTPHNTAPR